MVEVYALVYVTVDPNALVVVQVAVPITTPSEDAVEENWLVAGTAFNARPMTRQTITTREAIPQNPFSANE